MRRERDKRLVPMRLGTRDPGRWFGSPPDGRLAPDEVARRVAKLKGIKGVDGCPKCDGVGMIPGRMDRKGKISLYACSCLRKEAAEPQRQENQAPSEPVSPNTPAIVLPTAADKQRYGK